MPILRMRKQAQGSEATCARSQSFKVVGPGLESRLPCSRAQAQHHQTHLPLLTSWDGRCWVRTKSLLSQILGSFPCARWPHNGKGRSGSVDPPCMASEL